MTPEVHGDERGLFVETYRRSWFPLGREMIQANRADRAAGCVVGLHYHLHQADYWYVVRGRARVVLHDLRSGSPTERGDLQPRPRRGGAPRACTSRPGWPTASAPSRDLTLTYLVDGYYNPDDELGVAWDDPDVGADWGLVDPVVSGRDQVQPGAGRPGRGPPAPLRAPALRAGSGSYGWPAAAGGAGPASSATAGGPGRRGRAGPRPARSWGSRRRRPWDVGRAYGAGSSP